MKRGWIHIIKEKKKHRLNVTEKGKALVQVINLFFEYLGITQETLHEYRKKGKLKKRVEEEPKKEVKPPEPPKEISPEEEEAIYNDAIRRIEVAKRTTTPKKSYAGVNIFERDDE